MGLFCGIIGFFCGIIGLFCGIIGLFCGITGLFCGIIGLFCGIIGHYRALLRHHEGIIGLFCGIIGLFCGERLMEMRHPMSFRHSVYTNPRPTVISMHHCPQNSPIISGSFSKNKVCISSYLHILFNRLLNTLIIFRKRATNYRAVLQTMIHGDDIDIYRHTLVDRLLDIYANVLCVDAWGALSA